MLGIILEHDRVTIFDFLETLFLHELFIFVGKIPQHGCQHVSICSNEVLLLYFKSVLLFQYQAPWFISIGDQSPKGFDTHHFITIFQISWTKA